MFEIEREEMLEKQYLRKSLENGGFSPANIDLILQEHELQDNKVRQAWDQYWKQFVIASDDALGA
ncbi:hypothetical protein [Leptothoe spongobia]|nr:hypothetical protein [Leptothoe spongobia]